MKKKERRANMGYVSSARMNTEEKENKLTGISKVKSLMSSRVKAFKFKKRNDERYCTVQESLEESLKEVKQHKEGKIQLDTWEEYLRKKNN